MIVTCDCGAKLKIDDAKLAGRRIKVRCPRCGNVLPVQSAPQPLQVDSTVTGKAPGPARSPAGPLVLVAHDSDVVRHTVCEVLIDSGFQVDTAANGMEALTKATQMIPRGLVLDVGLAGSIYGFEVCERLKNNPKTSGIKIILLSSVYDMRRYKRTPNSLYGADDYIEKHHIPDFLPSKMRRLIFPEEFADKQPKTTTPLREELPEMSRPPAREFKPSLLNHMALQPQTGPDFSNPSPIPPRTPVAKTVTGDIQESVDISPESFSLEASIFQKEECDIPRVDAADPQAVEKARRFARIIVSDIALYNHDLVMEGIIKETFYELLRNDIQEGRELYEKRVPPVIRTKKDYYQEAFDNFLAASKQKNVR